MDWTKILWAIALVAMLVVLIPRAKYMLQNSPKGSGEDWKTFSLLIAGVVLFVMFLIWMVRN